MDAITVISLLAAGLITYVVFEAVNQWQEHPASPPSVGQLLGKHAHRADTSSSLPTWQAFLVGLLPGRYSPRKPQNVLRVRELIRRAGYYPYRSEGEFYAAAIRTFTVMAAVGLALAALVAYKGSLQAAPVVAGAFLFVGLRRPYTRLQNVIRQRRDAMPYNMLPVLSSLYALLQSGVGVQEALRRAANVGGPFSNLMLFFLSRLAAEETPQKAIAAVRRHLPDEGDLHMARWLNMLEAYFVHSQPLADQVEILIQDLRNYIDTQTEERASVTLRRAGIYGVLAVIGMLLTQLLPAIAMWRSAQP